MTPQLATSDEAPAIRWTVEAFDRFWAGPDPSLVPRILTDDVAGHWPRTSSPVRGKDAYTQAIRTLLSIAPDFRASAVEHCGDDDRVFVRWRAQATVRGAMSAISGVDRVLLRNGLVAENRIYSDHPLFQELADLLASS